MNQSLLLCKAYFLHIDWNSPKRKTLEIRLDFYLITKSDSVKQLNRQENVRSQIRPNFDSITSRLSFFLKTVLNRNVERGTPQRREMEPRAMLATKPGFGGMLVVLAKVVVKRCGWKWMSSTQYLKYIWEQVVKLSQFTRDYNLTATI